MKIEDVKLLHLLTNAVLHADKQVVASKKREGKGYTNCPQIGNCYDQSDAADLPEVEAARETLRQAITQAFTTYRKELMGLLSKTPHPPEQS